jgi:hypothetical protein
MIIVKKPLKYNDFLKNKEIFDICKGWGKTILDLFYGMSM